MAIFVSTYRIRMFLFVTRIKEYVVLNKIPNRTAVYEYLSDRSEYVILAPYGTNLQYGKVLGMWLDSTNGWEKNFWYAVESSNILS